MVFNFGISRGFTGEGDDLITAIYPSDWILPEITANSIKRKLVAMNISVKALDYLATT